MSYKLFFISLFILLVITSCKRKNHEGESIFDTLEVSLTSSYFSDDGMYIFDLYKVNNSTPEKILIHEKNFDSKYTLSRISSAEGIKYHDEKGHIFWLKGNHYIFYDNDKKISEGRLINTTVQKLSAQTDQSIFGSYVSDGYAKKDQGFDWISVTLTPLNNKQVKVSIRSRADQKKPSCTFDGSAILTEKNTLKLYDDGMNVSITIKEDSLIIKPENQTSENRLYFYCSGGATLAGNYLKINESPDPDQIDITQFSKYLNYQKYGFLVSVKEDTLTVMPNGLENDNQVYKTCILGTITNAETGDLNVDGFPELIIYEVSDGSGSYGSIHGYSINNGKSLSMTGKLPDLRNVDSLSRGYMGHDEFAIVENTLVRRFPVYNTGDTNANPTGKTRQIQYKLIEGEALRKFVIDKVVEY
ncbi:hypothetical protein [Marinigracilibium pacificum]|uniref:Uncharacterized protein n=1 Tax=Marinigracilibium pacificum TaxID=2729599 RepID=A0A848IVQ8_9BACT|nr:hypothetical protein [Marinigracilibium pacificum]NMM47331.1 hypothetical protein [Marinigracilibium pacificum]